LFCPEIGENIPIEICRVWQGDSQDNGKRFHGISPISGLLGIDWRFELRREGLP
jgi:hypothetical protein